ncbi:MAG: DUF4254 domain-containing protein [Cryomorphaceae bacterium]|nr:DUF4254 domain-containing protein [Cryomorphaceae bacterium]
MPDNSPHDHVQSWYAIFERVIEDYHVNDEVDQPINNPFSENTLEGLLYKKCWIDTVQWHLEDIVRDPEIKPESGMEVKRRIDKSNQERTDLVERLDDVFIDVLNLPETPAKDAILNTESMAWAIDRLSILALKVYHMNVEVARGNTENIDFLKAKQQLLHTQRADLTRAIAQLMEEVQMGKRYYKVYRQVKMYNDPSLNPVLYNKSKS